MQTGAQTLLSLAAMSSRLGVRVKWLHDEAASGRVPSLKAGRVWLFNPKAVERVLLARAGKLQEASA